mmetsp:Transcript_16942/g.43794  ORF Transcript_16942/g.43794 Transcript_16942/m.43794 type:complete len:85 (-) Transcript_16942:77-331(-)
MMMQIASITADCQHRKDATDEERHDDQSDRQFGEDSLLRHTIQSRGSHSVQTLTAAFCRSSWILSTNASVHSVRDGSPPPERGS